MEFLKKYSTSNPHPVEAGLPTLSKLGNPKFPDNLDIKKVAAAWIDELGKAAAQTNVEGVLALLVNSDFKTGILDDDHIPSASGNVIPVYWRDFLSLTWDFRTFEGTPAIQNFLQARLQVAKISNLKLGPVSLDKLFPDLVWIQLFFTFETEVGIASGIARLVPITISASQPKSLADDLNTGDVTWRAHLVFTNLEDLKGFPESLGVKRNGLPNHGKWEEQRRRENAYEDRDPTVLIIGGGQSGLDVAARLKALGVDALIVEKNKRIGDNWRLRYDALCLHDTVWCDHMPYLPFVSEIIDVASSNLELAGWLESYAEALELNVWTSIEALEATQDRQSKIWLVRVKKGDGSERIFKVNHIVMASGLKGGTVYVPEYPGMDRFQGTMLHSTEYHNAQAHLNKKVIVIGAGTSAHDICVDYVDSGIDVTMFQRSSTYILSALKGLRLLLDGLYSENGLPTDVADRVNASFPTLMMAGVAHRGAQAVAEVDREILEGLHRVGFKLNMGYKDAGALLQAMNTASGYYVDVGGSQHIIDGKIKLKNDSQIKEFTKTGIKFDNDSELEADVVVFCTGYIDSGSTMRKIFGDAIAEGVGETFGLNKEGETKGLYRQLKYKGLYSMMGNFPMCRFYSKHVALQIKAMEEGIFDGKTYSK
ncbi:hypothetical protein CPB83DRAFT_899868 [Crepidotus variabilis]|uniref:Flavin-containing monooxygenase n=1 Tax=Crepidotus variabilis TaxID=179855 RepID=A0A9P6E493_9AGAR|nr:hypothetical protein CPB83DRAFT_899868 [Crepidotus variabilis]